jgi:hypothetical protein
MLQHNHAALPIEVNRRKRVGGAKGNVNEETRVRHGWIYVVRGTTLGDDTKVTEEGVAASFPCVVIGADDGDAIGDDDDAAAADGVIAAFVSMIP